ncbi:erythromycin esterase family protein [Deinococcus sp. QL22]|uniref:erythromycin esterase family protein n=1 Tax=Deinococcus sp. QL22 TaxID=2939437 RepID=UPI0020175A9B|nr:erythromycin esterase family protein [Deinococcus sp. QL22]UQN09096.1 erythromycin esterase family protein [Deinococcus sp. QL22]
MHARFIRRAAVALVLAGLTGSCQAQNALIAAVRAAAVPISEQPHALNPVIQAARTANVVLIGEATHGTHEFYRTRADITKRLITEQGFDAVVIEGDWPEAQRVNRYVRGQGPDRTPEQALAAFERFPRWMWRNVVVRDFVGWLRTRNASQPGSMAAFYGMDLYSLRGSRREVLRGLSILDPALARRAESRYGCLNALDPALPDDPAVSVAIAAQTCAQNVEDVFAEVRQLVTGRRRLPGAAPEVLFDLEQNARVVKNAVNYERASLNLLGGGSSWNVRDQHMTETLEAIRAHLAPGAKIVVWAHNSHLGDARATEMARQNEVNVGQLVRQRYGKDALLIGMTTHTGSVTAAPEWNLPGRLMQIRPSLEGSYERLFHDTGIPNFLLDLRRAPQGLVQDRLERAIGVQYVPASERLSHYFLASLPRQFDLVLHFDVTRALTPLDPPS